MSAERVREFYRRQGEERQQVILLQQLREVAANWESRGFILSAEALRKALADLAKQKAEVDVDQAHHEAWSAGIKHERERIIKLLEQQEELYAVELEDVIALIKGEQNPYARAEKDCVMYGDDIFLTNSACSCGIKGEPNE